MQKWCAKYEEDYHQQDKILVHPFLNGCALCAISNKSFYQSFISSTFAWFEICNALLMFVTDTRKWLMCVWHTNFMINFRFGERNYFGRKTLPWKVQTNDKRTEESNSATLYHTLTDIPVDVAHCTRYMFKLRSICVSIWFGLVFGIWYLAWKLCSDLN